jgi:hypothetical protein
VQILNVAPRAFAVVNSRFTPVVPTRFVCARLPK